MTLTITDNGVIGADILRWPNAATVYDDGRIAIADSGHDRVVVLDPKGKLLWEAGGKGFGLTNLREPISVAITPDQYLFVSDWHNHRWVVYDPYLKASHQVGHIGYRHKNHFKTLKSFLSNISVEGVYAATYFKKDTPPTKVKHSLSMLAKGLWWYARHPKILQQIFCDQTEAMFKPNGAVFTSDHMIMTQKAQECVTIYQMKPQHKIHNIVRHIEGSEDGIQFKRLANLAQDSAGNIYVCDQQNFRVVVLDKDYNFLRSIEIEQDKKTKPHGPFGIQILYDRYVAISASYTLEIHDLKTDGMIYQNSEFGETHGLAWDANSHTLYFVDRENSCLHAMKVEA